jgi:hypothetical protein
MVREVATLLFVGTLRPRCADGPSARHRCRAGRGAPGVTGRLLPTDQHCSAPPSSSRQCCHGCMAPRAPHVPLTHPSQNEGDGVHKIAEALRSFGPHKPCLVALDDVWAPAVAAAMFMPHLDQHGLQRDAVSLLVVCVLHFPWSFVGCAGLPDPLRRR